MVVGLVSPHEPWLLRGSYTSNLHFGSGVSAANEIPGPFAFVFRSNVVYASCIRNLTSQAASLAQSKFNG